MKYSVHSGFFVLVLCAGIILGGCKGLKLDQVQSRSASDWLTEGDSPQRAHAVNTAVTPPLEQAWLYNAGAGFGPGSPLILREAVIVATRKGEVHAIDYKRGRRLGFESFGDAVEGTPLIQNGLLFVPVAYGKRALTAYNLRNASTKWRVSGAAIEAGLLAFDDAIAAVDTDGILRVYDQQDGTVRWEHMLGDDVQVKATPLLAEGLLIVANDKGEVAAFRPEDGTVVWTRTLQAPVYRSPASDNGLLFIPTTRGHLMALDARRGTTRWNLSLPDTTVRFTAPAVGAGQVVVGATDGQLRSLSSTTGEVQWTFEVDGAITGAPLLTPEFVFFGTMRKMLYAVERGTGVHRWDQQLKGRVKSAMAARDGHLVVLTEPRYVYLFKSNDVGTYAISQ